MIVPYYGTNELTRMSEARGVNEFVQLVSQLIN